LKIKEDSFKDINKNKLKNEVAIRESFYEKYNSGSEIKGR
jgi:hypothetical protein